MDTPTGYHRSPVQPLPIFWKFIPASFVWASEATTPELLGYWHAWPMPSFHALSFPDGLSFSWHRGTLVWSVKGDGVDASTKSSTRAFLKVLDAKVWAMDPVEDPGHLKPVVSLVRWNLISKEAIPHRIGDRVFQIRYRPCWTSSSRLKHEAWLRDFHDSLWW